MLFAEYTSRESTRLPLWFPVLVGCGIALYFGQNAPMPLWPWALGVAVAFAIFLKGWNHAWVRLPAVAVFAVMLGISAAALRLSVVEAPVLHEPVFFKMVTGTIEDIQRKEKKVKLVLSHPTIETLEQQETPLHISITLRKLEVPLAIGERVSLPAILFPPPAPAMPHAYDFARMFYFDQLGAVGFSNSSPSRGEVGRGASTENSANNAPTLTLPLWGGNCAFRFPTIWFP